MLKRRSKIIYYLKTGRFYRQMKLKKWLKKNKNAIINKQYDQTTASIILGYKVNIDEPTTFNEKILWLKHNYKNVLWKQCADKLGSKQFLIEHGFKKYVPETFGQFETSKCIDLDKLPNKFVLKTNHDCGTVVLCDKSCTDFCKVFEQLDKSVKKKYSLNNCEWVYEDVNPTIFAEEILIPESGNDLMDFKFFCFKGIPKFLFCVSNRSKDIKITVHDATTFDMYPCSYIYPKGKKPMKPHCYEEMLKLVKDVAKYFEFVRVDVYATNQGPKIGELTFFSQSGHGVFYPKKYDYEFGKYFDNTDFAFNKND